ncbi:TIGR04283 family arsenosugar biosynthesis glycosyltransferase [Leptolyngbya sp. AN02str]|uniref:TIGR04283 family arsenosugar biosynthesis glycosyltransferase n=1 Tax=Leptolyngbya sp. AN02str TaxID=3423363 RepID=UPI003D315992
MPIEHLILFTRYPEPGRTKTRLIPALGAEAAANVQRAMTAHVLRQVQALQQERSLQVSLWFAGGSVAQMQAWLGNGWQLKPQPDGDLGERILVAIQSALAKGAERVVVIGADCPTLDAPCLAQAFNALHHHDLVLGPATDGGYYLIGLTKAIPELFRSIDWGTERVFAQTMAIAQSLNLTASTLVPLTDVDYPADLPTWEQVRQRIVSVIIPVLNESATLANCLAYFRSVPEMEVIVVDGGSGDDTVAIAQSLGVQVMTSPPGRAHQMNAGAAIATGDTLLFLHADTRLPANAAQHIRQTLAQPGAIAGAFDLNIAGAGWGLRIVEWGVYWRSRLLQLPYGDQAIFLSKQTFEKMGGFVPIPLMEDFDLVQRLKQWGSVAIAPAAVTTSARRWQTLGTLRTTLLNQGIVLGYYLGVSPETLARWYRDRKGKLKPQTKGQK